MNSETDTDVHHKVSCENKRENEVLRENNDTSNSKDIIEINSESDIENRQDISIDTKNEDHLVSDEKNEKDLDETKHLDGTTQPKENKEHDIIEMETDEVNETDKQETKKESSQVRKEKDEEEGKIDGTERKASTGEEIIDEKEKCVIEDETSQLEGSEKSVKDKFDQNDTEKTGKLINVEENMTSENDKEVKERGSLCVDEVNNIEKTNSDLIPCETLTDEVAKEKEIADNSDEYLSCIEETDTYNSQDEVVGENVDKVQEEEIPSIDEKESKKDDISGTNEEKNIKSVDKNVNKDPPQDVPATGDFIEIYDSENETENDKSDSKKEVSTSDKSIKGSMQEISNESEDNIVISSNDHQKNDFEEISQNDDENIEEDEIARACQTIQEGAMEKNEKDIIEIDTESGTEKGRGNVTGVCEDVTDEREKAMEIDEEESEKDMDELTGQDNKDPSSSDEIMLEVGGGKAVQLDDSIDLVLDNDASTENQKRKAIPEIDDILDGIRSFSPVDRSICKDDSAGTNPPSPDVLVVEESAPPKKKERLDLSSTSSEQNEMFKHRMDSCPPLTQEHIDLMLSYLENPKMIIKEELFLMQLKLSKFPRIKRYSVPRQLERWSKYFNRQVINGEVKLVLRLSKKIVLAMEKYSEVIKDAHENSGLFVNQVANEKKEPLKHNSYNGTFCLIESKFGVGGREFGMSKYNIYLHVANCSKCSIETKKLPSLSKVLGTSEKPKHALNVLSTSPDDPYNIVSLNTSGESSSAPLSMLWDRPTPGSIWHDQKGLASETDPYSKLLGVIQEIGLDLVAATQGDNPSKSKFITKLYCAVRLIQEMKSTCEKNELIADVQFMIDYLKLQEAYIEKGRLDLFLYDINLLAIKYNLANSELFMQLVNSCVSKISKNYKPPDETSIFDTPIDIPEYLLDSIRSEETAETSET